MSTLMAEVFLAMVVLAALLVAIGVAFAVQKRLLPLAILGPLAALLFVVSVAGEYLVVQKTKREVRAGWNLVPVLVATRTLAAGDLLSNDAVTLRPVPEQFLTPSVFRAGNRDLAMGRRVVGPVKPGEPITQVLVGIGLAGCAPVKR